jgi:glycosyltransferase involved in cell wall biosynthesis
VARVAVVHNTLDLRSGADAVCLHACEALQDAHEVTLLTLSHPPLSELNALFDTDADVAVETPPGSTSLGRAFEAVADRAGPLLPLRSVLLDRFVRRRAADFDVAVSTANEFALPLPSVQYVHYPQFNGRAVDEGGPGDALWSRLAGLGDRRLPADATLLTNSAWTAERVAERYGRRPTVLFPPVDPIEGGADWRDREPGVVVAGRVAPDKRTLDAFELVESVRRRGHDVHLHVVGSAAPAYRSYVARVRRAAAGREWASVETDVSRDRLEAVLTRHRYGLNLKPDEHFGMTLAEYVAAGMLPFAPDSGGQVDVLGGDEDLLFGSVAGGAARLASAVETGRRPSLPRDRFGRERFHAALREHVDDALCG